MKSRATEYEALLTPIERFVSLAGHYGAHFAKDPDGALIEIRRMCAAASNNGDADYFQAIATKAGAIRFAIDWFRSGLPKVLVGHKHAAALMCTRMPADAAPELRMLWDGFVVDVPDGMIVDAGLPVRHVGLFRTHFDAEYEPDGANARGAIKCVAIMADPVGDPHKRAFPYAFEAVDDLRELAERSNLYEDIPSEKGRCLMLRLLLGVIAELNQPRESATIAHGASRPRLNRRGEPIVSTFALSRDIKVDCREAVHEYMRGARGTSPTVQSLVRGHWKKQPCGTARSDRRLIFVEPYWRGPETAPIALRSHAFGVLEEVQS